MEVLSKRRGSKAPARDHDDNNPVKSVRDKLAEPGTAQEQTRSGAWCREEGDMTRLMFDVPAEDADRAACMGLALALRPGETIPASPTFFRATSIPCLVWPLQADVTQDDELTSGGSVLKRAVPEQGTGRQLPGVGAQGKGKVGEASRGRPAQRKSWQVPIPTPRRRDQQDSSQTLGLSPTPKAKPRTLERAPSQAEADLPSISASPAVLPSPPSAISALPPMEDTISAEGTSPVSHPTSPPPSAIPGPSTSGTPSVPQTADSQLIESAVSVPSSMKAKGKQRALSEVRMRTPSPVQDSGALTWIHRSTSRGRRSASRERTPTLGSPVENSMGQFFHGLDPSPPRPQVSPQGSQYQPLPMPPSPTTMDMHSHLPLLLPIGHPAPSFYQPVDNNQPYGDGTIDPSLLGGGMMEYGMVYGADVRMPSPSPGPYSSDDDEAPAPTRSGRRPVKRHIPDDMINTPSDDDYATSSSSGYASDFKPAVKPAPKPAVKSAPKPGPKPKPKPKQAATKAKGGQTKVIASATPFVVSTDKFFRYSGPPWPSSDLNIFCHHCRRRSNKATMTFDECEHSYCIRCIMLKYPPGTVPFQLQAPMAECPRCNDFCACDVCTNRRGEVYMRERAPRAPRLELAPRFPAGPRERPRHPSLERMELIQPATYYATMYDRNGAPIGSTFLGADGDETTILARPIKRRRVFIGSVPESWNLGPEPTVFIEPEKNRRLESARYYVGNPAVLSLPLRRTPAPAALPLTQSTLALLASASPAPSHVNLDSSSSALSSLDATDEDGQGECASRQLEISTVIAISSAA
ncbi:hypothetical protein C8R43DRAFT_1041759 [Mycena crocata]|nr:hypothetical protein C8R43DRAFT_1041759 [Mycena crocata]